jgi:hypothetical protein
MGARCLGSVVSQPPGPRAHRLDEPAVGGLPDRASAKARYRGAVLGDRPTIASLIA